MNTLFPYAAIVGTALFATYSFANFLLEPSTGASYIPPEARSAVVDSQREQTRMERWRSDQDAMRNKGAYRPARAADTPAVQDATSSPVDTGTVSNPMRVAPVALAGEPTASEAAHAKEAARAKLKAERARRVARERARQQRMVSRQQHQQAWPQQPFGFFSFGQPAQQQRQQQRQQDAYAWGNRW
jgi:hypothetical protein